MKPLVSLTLTVAKTALFLLFLLTVHDGRFLVLLLLALFLSNRVDF